MQIRIVAEDPAGADVAWLVTGLFEDGPAPPAWVREPAARELFANLVESKDLSASPGDASALHGMSGIRAASLLVAGLGPREAFDAGSAFDLGVLVGKRLGGRPRGAVGLVLPEAGMPAEVASRLVQGAIVGTAGPGLAKSEPARYAFEELRLILPPGSTADPALVDRAMARGAIVGRAINLARELVNLPPARKTPRLLADRIRIEAGAAGLEVEVWDEARIRRERFGGLLGVAAGSDEPPSFVTLHWNGAGPEAPHLALVGKGVTFDSGGLSLKPSASMEDMKADMSGAAIVAAAMTAIARLRLPVNVRGYLALVENMSGGRAMKLGDVLSMRNGKTVEVMNTDAEGRLILADALSFAAEQAPTRMVDLATLTGSCVVALGTKVAGLFANDDETAELVRESATAVGERVWRLPMDGDFRESLKSPVADLKNVGSKWGGAIVAAKFLEEFVGGRPWAHLDIAGPAWAESDSPARDAGGTGCFVRTLVRMAEEAGEP
ncbi:leucyl aminopeptidase [Tautonia sociabilis]|uniref:Probable cytosol aminopeptidase n=1 Tax=Tautonia sociabilis TaxID=2080755 RepID=A0A432MKA0_9BACT|nr:leucyl aminopeptidase [Tautonia sociabilis]RUL87558.1 leucyl aminopeptidase [Tautonia sociabilis]